MNHHATYNAPGQKNKALADINRAVELGGPGSLWRSLQVRGGYLAQQCEWEKAIIDLDQAFAMNGEEWAQFVVYRDHALLQLMSGNTTGHQAGITRLAEHMENSTDADRQRWLIFATVAGPNTITTEQHDRLLKIVAEKLTETEAAWKPRLTAAIYYRAGKFKEAADLFDQNSDGPRNAAFHCLPAMAHDKAGNRDQAKQLFDEATGWIKQQEHKEQGPAVPSNHGWHDWAIFKSLQPQAAAQIRRDPEPEDNAEDSSTSSDSNQL